MRINGIEIVYVVMISTNFRKHFYSIEKNIFNYLLEDESL